MFYTVIYILLTHRSKYKTCDMNKIRGANQYKIMLTHRVTTAPSLIRCLPHQTILQSFEPKIQNNNY